MMQSKQRGKTDDRTFPSYAEGLFHNNWHSPCEDAIQVIYFDTQCNFFIVEDESNLLLTSDA